MDAGVAAKVAAVKDAISKKPYYCTGVLPLPALKSALFYQTNGSMARRIDLSQATFEELELLSEACEPATFGRNQEDILDESYRKALKLDADKFATAFSLEDFHLIDRIRTQLMSDVGVDKRIYAELYKLNVYEEGSFFKVHRDTPRGGNMFGSLVVVLPTSHEGGSLILRHGGEEWTFDSANTITEKADPHIAYIAFYSDVEHEVTTVESGHRVTLTWNLYYESAESSPTASVAPVQPDGAVLKAALSRLVADPLVLPEGGRLGFGLSFSYPVNSRIPFKDLIESLKGSDALITQACWELSLKVSLKAIYKDRRVLEYMVGRVVDLGDQLVFDGLSEVLQHRYKGRPIYNIEGGNRNSKAVPVLWVTDLTTHSRAEKPYTSYGNEASLDWAYGDLCLMVALPRAGKRQINPETRRPEVKQGV